MLSSRGHVASIDWSGCKGGSTGGDGASSVSWAWAAARPRKRMTRTRTRVTRRLLDDRLKGPIGACGFDVGSITACSCCQCWCACVYGTNLNQNGPSHHVCAFGSIIWAGGTSRPKRAGSRQRRLRCAQKMPACHPANHLNRSQSYPVHTSNKAVSVDRAPCVPSLLWRARSIERTVTTSTG